jgi:hypothetical protein
LGLREARGNEELLGPPGRGTGETEPREEAAKVLEACPDVEWQLIFALARYGGLRTPSETLALKWSDVNWEARMFTVRSPKTEHHEDGGIRVVPIFKELRPYLDAVYFSDGGAEDAVKSDYVITRYRGQNANLRTQLERIILRAGLKPWPKIFQNLRATRATELVASGVRERLAADWLGHSPKIASEHYWRPTAEEIRRAIEGDATGDAQGDSVHVTRITTTNDKREESPENCRAVSLPVVCGGSDDTTSFVPAHPFCRREESSPQHAIVASDTIGPSQPHAHGESAYTTKRMPDLPGCCSGQSSLLPN